jgi:predicted DnaQ family exonuclease/DinG family helicase
MSKVDYTKLPDTVIGIDVETTSLEPATGEIIEVAAIRYDTRTGKAIGEYMKLCSSSRPLSPEITAITSITNEMISSKKSFASHIDKLKEFIGDSVIFAHNASFDINYLAYHGLKLDNTTWDTFALSSIAWPKAESYNLGMLAQQNNIKVEGEHRAGADVQMTWLLLQEIIKHLKVPKDTYEKVAEIIDKSDLMHYFSLFSSGKMLSPKKEEINSSSKEDATAASTLKGMLGSKGVLSQNIAGFKYRSQQLSMAENVLKTIEDNDINLIEAGTGVGKTYGYLTPLLLHYTKNNNSESVAGSKNHYTVSTFTKHLQDQLYLEDIPALAKVLGVDIKTAILKGRSNYLCTGRLQQAISRKSIKEDEALLLIKLLVWMSRDDSGDFEKINLSHQTKRYMYHLHADSISCRRMCPTNNPTCPYYRAKREAAKADLLIINHSLLAQLYLDDSVLSSTNLIIDEAHHLEEAFRKATGRDLSEHQLAEIVAPFVQLSKKASKVTHGHIVKEAQSIIDEYQQLYAHFNSFLTDHMHSDTVSLTSSIRKTTSWKRVVATSLSWHGRMQFLIGLMQGITAETSELKKVEEAIKEAEKFNSDFKAFILGDDERIRWIEIYDSFRPEISVHDIALNVQDHLKPIFESTRSVVLTSATLTIGDSYDYIRARLGVGECNEVVLDTPFDYKEQMLIYIVDDAPNPSDNSYIKYITTNILIAAKLINGRLLGLFTAHKMVGEVYRGMVSELRDNNIKLLAQKITGGRHNIINKFKKTARSVLLGTDSFWEGIDVPGSSLSLVMIAKLPFSNPKNPVINAISESENIDSFSHVSVPLMILKLRQGVGRLIRKKSDFGAVVIFDSRFLKHEYGKQVLDSLPPATVHIGSTKDLVPTLTGWFGEEQINKWKKEGDR